MVAWKQTAPAITIQTLKNILERCSTMYRDLHSHSKQANNLTYNTSTQQPVFRHINSQLQEFHPTTSITRAKLAPKCIGRTYAEKFAYPEVQDLFHYLLMRQIL